MSISKKVLLWLKKNSFSGGNTNGGGGGTTEGTNLNSKFSKLGLISMMMVAQI